MDREQLLQALRNAHAAGDTGAAQRIAGMIQALPSQEVAPAPQQAPQPAPVAQDPMLPSPDTDTRSTQEYLRDTGQAPAPLIDTSMIGQPRGPMREMGPVGDAAIAGLSGLTRGATELAALPDTLGGFLDAGYERLGLIPAGSRENVPSISGMMREGVANLTEGGSQYEPQTTLGDYTQTVGEFIGGGAGGRIGLGGGLMSEAAGQLTEDTSVEPYARIAGGLLGGMAATPRPTSAPVRNPNTPQGQRAMMANELRREGINVTAGQQRNSPLLRRMEGTLDAPDVQPEQFTRVIMNRLGSQSEIATPQALRAVQDDIVKQMDEAVQGVKIAPNARQAAQADEVAATYLSNVETGAAVPRVREIATEIAARAQNGQPVDLATIRTWRSDIGNLTTSSNNATRRAAHSLRSLLDDMTDTALTNAGRADDVRKLADARRQYRDFLAVRDASTRAGDASSGVLSPAQLNQSMIRVMGRENYGVGRTTPTSDFTRSAAAMMRSAPAVQSGGVRSLESLPMLLSGAGGYAAGGPWGLLAGVAAPPLAQAGMRSAPAQALLTNPATVFGQLTRTTPGLLAQE